MIDYELALELKNAGFFKGKEESPYAQDKEVQDSLGHPIRKPTLSELIEACGECKLIIADVETHWNASGYD